MRGFEYCVPTNVIFGADSSKRTGEMVAKYGAKKVFIVYGGGSVVRSGLLDDICGQMTAQGIAYETYGGVQPNPRLDFARQGVKKAMGFDFILAVGGGSVIDTAKSISHGVATPEIDIWEYYLGNETVSAALPVGVVLTIPAAGSETSDSSVLTDNAKDDKRGLGTPFNRPVFAIMDTKLPMTLPKYQLGCGVTDIMMHTMDRYFNAITDNAVSDAFALALLKVVVGHGVAVVENPTDEKVMSEIMWAGSVSHNNLTGLGHGGDFAPHNLGHVLSAIYDLAHGASLSTVWPSWARYCMDANPKRFADYGKAVFGIDATLSDVDAAKAAIDATEQYFLSLGMPVGMEAAVGKKTQAELENMAEICSFWKTRSIGTFKSLSYDDMLAIYTAVNDN